MLSRAVPTEKRLELVPSVSMLLSSDTDWKRWRERTCRLGLQVGLSPLFSLSISSIRSEVVFEGNSGMRGVESELGGLSGMGPSQSSVRKLSDILRLEEPVILWLNMSLGPWPGRFLGVGVSASSSASAD